MQMDATRVIPGNTSPMPTNRRASRVAPSPADGRPHTACSIHIPTTLWIAGVVAGVVVAPCCAAVCCLGPLIAAAAIVATLIHKSRAGPAGYKPIPTPRNHTPTPPTPPLPRTDELGDWEVVHIVDKSEPEPEPEPEPELESDFSTPSSSSTSDAGSVVQTREERLAKLADIIATFDRNVMATVKHYPNAPPYVMEVVKAFLLIIGTPVEDVDGMAWVRIKTRINSNMAVQANRWTFNQLPDRRTCFKALSFIIGFKGEERTIKRENLFAHGLFKWCMCALQDELEAFSRTKMCRAIMERELARREREAVERRKRRRRTSGADRYAERMTPSTHCVDSRLGTGRLVRLPEGDKL